MERCQGAGCTNFAQIATPTGTTFGDTGLIAATNYSYRVKAVDAATNVSVNYSTVATATTQAARATRFARPIHRAHRDRSQQQSDQSEPGPPPPTAVGAAWPAIAWSAVRGRAAAPLRQIATPVTNSYSDPGLTAGTSYSYRVRAIDGAGNLSLNYSNTASATPPLVHQSGDRLWDERRDRHHAGRCLGDRPHRHAGQRARLGRRPSHLWAGPLLRWRQRCRLRRQSGGLQLRHGGLYDRTLGQAQLCWAAPSGISSASATAPLWQSGCKEFYFNPSNQLTFGSFATGDTVSSTIADTNWHHVAVTFTDSTNMLKIYVDGALVTTATKALEADGAGHVVTVGNLHREQYLQRRARRSPHLQPRADPRRDSSRSGHPDHAGPDTTPPSTVTGLTATAVSTTRSI